MYLVLVCTVVAVIATGVHVMSFTAPALAEQERQANARDERNVVTHPPTAATDGLPVPALVGGVVIAFAVGIAGGQVHRRRRIAHRRLVASERPAPVPTPPARPAPPPPETTAPEPKAVEVAAPVAPAPPPPEPRPAAPRVVAPPSAPTPPAPEPPRTPQPRRTGEPLRFVPLVKKKPRTAAPRAETPRPATPRAETPRPATPRAETPRADSPLTDSPEVPRAQASSPAADLRAPLETAPEALHAPGEQPAAAAAPGERPAAAPAPPVEVSAPARRFARPVPWPQEAEQLWTCEIAWKAGYRKSTFRAMAGPPGPGKRRAIGESPSVRWTLMGEPEPPTPDLAVRVRALVEALEGAGWEHIGRGKLWYAQRFIWRGSGEPQPIAVPELAEN
jgi:hypothetical protein